MAGFRKAKGEQAALKLALYGPAGAGKSFTALLIAEGLAKLTSKRIAYVDTERGTDFYCQRVPGRRVHPEAFDFDALYSKSLTEVLAEVKQLDLERYGVLVIDSISHLWDAAKAAYTGRPTKIGTIPLHAWGKIKAPYKELMAWLLNSPLHVLLCGRQGSDFQEDEETGEIKALGFKMRAESETPYEPHICLRLEVLKDRKRKEAVPVAFAEKDRTGVLAGRSIEWPNFDNLAKPLLGLLGTTQAQVPTEAEAGTQDAEALERQERERETRSKELLEEFGARFSLARSGAEVEEIAKRITPEIKRLMVPADVMAVRLLYIQAKKRRAQAAEPEFSVAGNGE
jgi:hypothetical protein